VNGAYEPVIGIECHVELKTRTKMFCGCPNEFGVEPNVNVCPVCLGLPGALPVPNRAAIEFMLRVGTAFDAAVPTFSKFDRKNYFYPDMPKNYQISQYDMPLVVGGEVRYWMDDGEIRTCPLVRIHLEEDTGKSTHAGEGADGRIAGSTYSLVDFNRAGVPLMECVSAPELRGADEAVAYLQSLRRTLLELGVSDVKMEEGSLRCDANVSVRLRGSTELGTKVEIKNMNSFRSVHRAIESETERQITLLESGGRVVQETRGWDELGNRTHSMRSKELAHDYRYFPDPDLVPLEIAAADVEKLRARLPELPWQRFERYTKAGIAPRKAEQLVELTTDEAERTYFQTLGEAIGFAEAANYRLGELARLANLTAVPVPQSGASCAYIRELYRLRSEGTINSKVEKELIERIWDPARSESPRAIVEREGLAQTSDPAIIDRLVEEILAQNADAVDAYRGGKTNVAGFLAGQVMKASKGKADPKVVQQVLKKRLDARI
jgi:aspartyl-tRNA(Asn)/glutamyl-tRNA(Gln) amidotransferase subunit B